MQSRNISKRGLKAGSSSPRIDLEIYFEALGNLYHKKENPEGILLLNMAENKLAWNLCKEKINAYSQTPIPEWVAGYTDIKGDISTREAIADYMENYFSKCEINPDTIAIASGATGAIEVTTFLLANPNDVVVIPSPSYSVYDQDIKHYSGLEKYCLQTHTSFSSSASDYKISIDQLEKAKKDIEKSGKDFKILIITSPDNPTGIGYESEELKTIASWCIAHEVHFVVNEIYGMTVLPNTHFQKTSFAQIMSEHQSDFLHLWSAVSKDFGISGFRFGWIHSHNEALMNGISQTNLGHSVSNHTQFIISQLLTDTPFLDRYFVDFQQQMEKSYLLVTKTLDRIGVPYLENIGSMFIWADFSSFLNEGSYASEMELWKDIYNKCQILVTPGGGMGHQYFGAFRIVYPNLVYNDLVIAMKKLEHYFLKER